jgi:putative acetyltransferase
VPIVVRPLRAGEERLYLGIVNAAIRGLAATHYDRDALASWVVPITDGTLADLARNPDREIRLIAELDGRPAGIGALVIDRAELRACYVQPGSARRGVGTALVRAIERLAVDSGLTHLALVASLNAEGFYVRLGYVPRERTHIGLRNGHALAAVQMFRTL